MKALLILGLSFLAVFSIGGGPSSPKFTAVQSLVLSQTNKQQIVAVFGKANEVINIKDIPGSTDSGEQWEYLEKGLSRATFSFDSKTETLQGWVWSVFQGDDEENLKVALKRFPEGAWEVETLKWVNPHHMPNDCYFKDKKRGISIEFNRTRKEVVSISRWNPSRKPSSTSDEKPPKYCIDGNCVDGVLGAEWTKKWSLCEVPQ